MVCALVGFAGSAQAQSLRAVLFGEHGPSMGRDFSAPPVARYVSEDGDVFTLDLTQGRPLLKFENSPEVWALQPQPAPRGDVIYKNDVGQPVLRATRLGGVTVFTTHRPDGEAAALAGGGAPLRLAPLGPQALLERLGQASLRASRAAKHVILFDAEATPASSAVIADAATVASVAVARLSEHPQGRSRLAGLKRVFLEEGRRVAATVQKGTLKITVTPSQGLAGRPSSGRIAAAVAAPDR
ncbi:DUF4908 domain-containing protein [Phenylobacterium soli]|uniref:DUF4908 domain-containing protein n=1 Tax=Phenylobacterium soli TaxID=2170551 RepID=UPI001D05AF56|nr:DUF4908 domain-containing protein [Phenylobacterium soli]